MPTWLLDLVKEGFEVSFRHYPRLNVYAVVLKKGYLRSSVNIDEREVGAFSERVNGLAVELLKSELWCLTEDKVT